MTNNLLKQIAKKFDYRTVEYAVRDITFMTCSIFTDTHIVSFKKIFNFKDFSYIFWYQQANGQVIFYRDGKKYSLMSKMIAEKYLKDISFAKFTANKLIKISDEINIFIKNHRTLSSLIKNWDYFYTTYRDFFAYHQAMYWPAEYLLKTKHDLRKQGRVKKIVAILDAAYKYNEKVVPNVENYFIKLDVGHLSYNELDKNVRANIKNKPKKRSVALVGHKVYIMSFKEASNIDKKIKSNYHKWLKNKEDITGYIANPGKVRGRVRLVKDLRNLKDCKAGDILVTTMTRPQYNAAIKKVSAIVTDEGGMLCHASMLAREFDIPCVVGTRNATRLLKDGDMVEVDAKNGIIRKL